MVAADAPRIAFWLERANLAACEIASLIGYELVIVDMEHGVFDAQSLDAVVAQCRAIGLSCYVRVAGPERILIQQALDFGADGVLLPQIRDAGHAMEACGYAKYPPLGTRGVGYSRAMRYGAVDTAFFEAENRRTVCHPMIETPGALEDVGAIAAMGTVDGLFVGPSDLSMTRGRGGFRFSTADQEDFRKVLAAARSAGKPVGWPAPSAEAFGFARAERAAYVTVSDDLTALQVGLAQAFRGARERQA